MSIASGPHYEISSSELADWIDRQVEDQYWMVGDNYLGGKIPFPSPRDEFTELLRLINRPLLVQAPETDTTAKGQVIHADDLDAIATWFRRRLHDIGEEPSYTNDREFWMCWKGSSHEWRLAENSQTARFFRMASTRVED